MKINIPITFIIFNTAIPFGVFANGELGITSVPTHVVDVGTDKRAREIWEKGNALADKGFVDRAHEYWKVALELDPNLSQEEEVASPASDIDIAEVAPTFHTNDKKKLDKISKLLAEAKKAYIQKEFPRVLQLLDKAETVSPQEPPVEALREGVILEDFTPDPKRPYNSLVKNEYEEAAENCRKRHYDLALQDVVTAEKIDPENLQVQQLKDLIEKKNEGVLLGKEVMCASVQWKEGNDEIALEILSELLQNHPDFQPAVDLKNQINLDKVKNKINEIQETLNRAQKEEKDVKFLAAKNDYEKILNLDPKNKDAIAGLSRTDIFVDPLPTKIGELEDDIRNNWKEKSLHCLEEIRALSPDNPKIKRWSEEISKMSENSLSEDEQARADKVYNFGLESYRNGNFADAKKFWEQTLEIAPNYQQAKQNLNRLLEDHPELK